MKKLKINKYYTFVKMSPKKNDVEFVFFFGDSVTVLNAKTNFIMITAAGTKFGLQN